MYFLCPFILLPFLLKQNITTNLRYKLHNPGCYEVSPAINGHLMSLLDSSKSQRFVKPQTNYDWRVGCVPSALKIRHHPSLLVNNA